jgi:hypothetical protein
LAPSLVVLDPELMEIIPGINPGVVEIVEGDTDSVITDRFEPDDPDMGAAMHQCLLSWTMPLHLGRGALDPKILGPETKPASVVERDFEYLFSPLQAEFDRPASGSVRAQPRLSRLTLR